jgi:hypothetical protein
MNNEKTPEIIFQDHKYFWSDNSWWDENFIAVPKALVQNLNLILFQQDSVLAPHINLNKPFIRIIKTADDLNAKERQLRKREIKKLKQIKRTDKAETNQNNDIYSRSYRLPGDHYRK